MVLRLNVDAYVGFFGTLCWIAIGECTRLKLIQCSEISSTRFGSLLFEILAGFKLLYGKFWNCACSTFTEFLCAFLLMFEEHIGFQS